MPRRHLARYTSDRWKRLSPPSTLCWNAGLARRLYLKIDTQGFEAEVLAGCAEVLPRIHAVEIELSLAPLYAGQQSWRWFIDFFESRGFDLWELRSAFRDPRDGRMLQMDGIFRRPEA